MGGDRGDTENSTGDSSRLFDLARTGSPEVLTHIDDGVSVDLADEDGNSLLMMAAYNGQEQLVTALLERGAAPDLRNGKGQTPLAGVVFKGYVPIAVALLDAGADPEVGNPPPLVVAEMFRQAEMAALLNQRLGRAEPPP